MFEEADGTTFYKTGVATGYEQGPIYEVGPGSESTNACTNYNQDEDVVFSIENAIGDLGAIYYKTEYDPTRGEDIAIVAGLHTLGFADTGNTVNCHFHSQDAVVRSLGGGAKPETIQDDTRKTLRFGGR
jgi:hypothetical protein